MSAMCQDCGEQPSAFRVTVARLSDEVLQDSATVCATCAAQRGFAVEAAVDTAATRHEKLVHAIELAAGCDGGAKPHGGGPAPRLCTACRNTLREALAAYEATDDHDHGGKKLKPGAPCPGGDCLVAMARKLLAEGGCVVKGMWLVRIWLKGEKRPHLLGSGGRMTRLHIHAAQFDTEAQADEVARDIERSNSERVVKAKAVRS